MEKSYSFKEYLNNRYCTSRSNSADLKCHLKFCCVAGISGFSFESEDQAQAEVLEQLVGSGKITGLRVKKGETRELADGFSARIKLNRISRRTASTMKRRIM